MALISQYFGTIQDTLPALEKQAEATVGPVSTGGYAQKVAEPDPDVELGVSNNFLYDEFIDNTGGSTDAAVEALRLVGDPVVVRSAIGRVSAATKNGPTLAIRN